MNSPLPDWKTMPTDERLKIVSTEWDHGMSAGQITWLFQNATRNAVIGLIHRAKLPTRERSNPVKTRTKAKVEPKPKPKKPSSVSASAFTAYIDPAEPTASVMDMIENNRAPLAGMTPVDIMGLPSRPGVLCRFPVDMDGIMGYCGIRCGDKMYCPDHYRVMYRPSEGKFRMPKEARL